MAAFVSTPADHEALITSLMDPASWPDGGGARRRIDTHVSTVVLAGEHAYKFKKPLDLGFLNFLDLEARHRACNEELRLNRRVAPDIYEAVCAVTGSIGSPALDGAGPVIDWAVRMRRFDPDAVLSNPAIPLEPALIEQLAEGVAALHASAARCAEGNAYGSPDRAFAPMRQNFEQINTLLGDGDGEMRAVRKWTTETFAHLADILRLRKVHGHVRECHGDLHLGNVALIAGRPVIFDAIEFNAGFRWIDTANDFAFLTMDLHHRGLDRLAYRFLDRYLQISGDYDAIVVLRFYEVYRAMVRAKIAAIMLDQSRGDPDRHEAARIEFDRYLDLAAQLIEPSAGALVITHGVSGSGKSHVSDPLVGLLPAIRLRSDIERKRLIGIESDTDATDLGGYTPELTQRTYARLAALARPIIEAGYVAIVDATFLRRWQRDLFSELAHSLQVPYVIVDCDAPVDVLRARIEARSATVGNVSDADLGVLRNQLAHREPLDDVERAHRITVTPLTGLDVDRLKGMVVSGRGH